MINFKWNFGINFGTFDAIFRNIMDNMTTEGHIYTSIDSEHWLPTDIE